MPQLNKAEQARSCYPGTRNWITRIRQAGSIAPCRALSKHPMGGSASGREGEGPEPKQPSPSLAQSKELLKYTCQLSVSKRMSGIPCYGKGKTSSGLPGSCAMGTTLVKGCWCPTRSLMTLRTLSLSLAGDLCCNQSSYRSHHHW
jgi:hypothetical protein